MAMRATNVWFHQHDLQGSAGGMMLEHNQTAASVHPRLREKRGSWRAWLPGFGAALTVLFVLGGVAEAAEYRNPLEGQPAIRRRLELRKNRFEITPGFMFSFNQDFRQFLGGSLALQYHITDWLGIAVQGAYGISYDTGLTQRVSDALPGTPSGLQPSKNQFRDHLADIRYLFSGYITITPFSGRLSFFGAGSVRYDFYALAGFGGLVLTNRWNPDDPENDRDCTSPNRNTNRCNPTNDGFKPGLMVGGGAHLFFTQWFGLNFEIRDYIASTNPGGFDVNGDPERLITKEDQTLTNNLFVTVGLSFVFPPRARVSR
jgi:outer membrane beta-barrel protein